ncbi:MAG: hypothetical protein Q8930_16740, partial [Bacillota bacterium]|nr:hypothetical protein [Bacillota bacterium]
LFILVFILTIIQLVSKGTGIFTAVFLDLAWGLVGVFLELKLMRCREQGTVYVEADRREGRFNLVEYNTYNDKYFVSETREEYIVKLPNEAYFKSYKKNEVVVEENPDIDIPVIEILTIEKISKPAESEYSVFALTGDKIKKESQKIIVRNKVEDIRKNYGK